MAATTGHTPGPWSTRCLDGAAKGVWYVESNRSPYPEEICVLYGSVRTEISSDGRLIAAAPDLLAALIAVRNGAKDDSPAMWAQVDAAIAKATGSN